MPSRGLCLLLAEPPSSCGRCGSQPQEGSLTGSCPGDLGSPANGITARPGRLPGHLRLQRRSRCPRPVPWVPPGPSDRPLQLTPQGPHPERHSHVPLLLGTATDSGCRPPLWEADGHGAPRRSRASRTPGGQSRRVPGHPARCSFRISTASCETVLYIKL